MDLEKFERNIRYKYEKEPSHELHKKVADIFSHVSEEWKVSPNELTEQELKIVATAILETETKKIHDEVQELLAEKERIERQLERKSEAFQEGKHKVFNAIEHAFDEPSVHTLAKLHHIKLQSIDLFDMLEEMVESAIITTLEKGQDTEETIEEITKEITYETLSEGPLSTVRIRKVASSIIQTAVDVADATPNQAEEIVRGTLRGVRSGLVKSISRLKKQLLYMPEEVKTLMTDGFESLQDELQRADTLFAQVIQNVADKSSSTSKLLLEKIGKEIHYDLQELLQISKETVEVMRTHLNQAIVRSAKVLNSEKAQDAKRMGIHAWSSAKTAVGDAIKSAKSALDKKQSGDT